MICMKLQSYQHPFRPKLPGCSKLVIACHSCAAAFSCSHRATAEPPCELITAFNALTANYNLLVFLAKAAKQPTYSNGSAFEQHPTGKVWHSFHKCQGDTQLPSQMKLDAALSFLGSIVEGRLCLMQAGMQNVDKEHVKR